MLVGRPTSQTPRYLHQVAFQKRIKPETLCLKFTCTLCCTCILRYTLGVCGLLSYVGCACMYLFTKIYKSVILCFIKYHYICSSTTQINTFTNHRNMAMSGNKYCCLNNLLNVSCNGLLTCCFTILHFMFDTHVSCYKCRPYCVVMVVSLSFLSWSCHWRRVIVVVLASASCRFSHSAIVVYCVVAIGSSPLCHHRCFIADVWPPTCVNNNIETPHVGHLCRATP